MRFPPVQLRNQRRSDAHGLEARAHAQRCHPRCTMLRESLDAEGIEVIVMIVREQDHVDRWQLLDGGWHFVKSLRSSKAYRRRALTEHRIDEYSCAVNFDQQCAVPKPGRA